MCVCNANASVGRDIEVVPGRGRPERRRQLISKTIEVDVYKKQTDGEEKGEIITIIRIIPENVFFFSFLTADDSFLLGGSRVRLNYENNDAYM